MWDLSLKDAGQLPDVEGDNIRFTFSSETVKGEDLTLIEYQGQLVWQEPMVFEGYERFMEIGKIMKVKYGPRMIDLAPDQLSELFLYGDRVQTPSIIADFRKKNLLKS